MLISNEKIEKLKKIDTDESDYVLQINEYSKHKHQYVESAEVFENVEILKERLYQKEQGASTLYLVFSINEQNLDDLNTLKIENILVDLKSIEEQYYPNKKYNFKIEKFRKIVSETLEKRTKEIENIDFIIDISSVSTFPIWNTKMRRRINSILKRIEGFPTEQLNKQTLIDLIRETQLEELQSYEKQELYDIDLIIMYLIIANKTGNINMYIIDSEKTNESIFMTNEIVKMTHALKLEKDQKYEYIYDTICKDMDEMFSKYGFCNFKNNKCVAQRHKTLFNRYPTPKTDGCCFKVVRKCKHNNRDGSCKIKCLPCKLFTCPYLSKLNVGMAASELILIRAFFNSNQKRVAVYDFYNSEEILLKKISSRE